MLRCLSIGLTLLLVLLIAQRSEAAIVFTQSTNHDGGFASSCAVTLAGSVAGRLLVVPILISNTSDKVTSVVGSVNGAYTRATYAGSSSMSNYIYYKPNGAGGSETVTVTLSSSNRINCALREYSGVATTTPLDTAATRFGTGSVATDGDFAPSVNSANDGSVFIGAISSLSTTATFAAGTGYSNLETGVAGSLYRHSSEDKILASAGAGQPTFTANNTGNYVASVAVFSPVDISPPTSTALSCNFSDIQNSIGVTADGGTVTIPAGSCSWGTSVSMPNTKGLKLIGAGAGTSAQCAIPGQTTYTCVTLAASTLLTIDTLATNQTAEVTGMTFIQAGNVAAHIRITGTAQAWRVHHNKFYSEGFTGRMIYVGGGNPGSEACSYGLIDHNTFDRDGDVAAGMVIECTRSGGLDAVLPGDWIWSQSAERGTAKMVYIEDNDFTTLTGPEAVEPRWGGSYVFRYNTVKNPYITTHSGCTNTGRNPIWAEIYNNTFTDDAGHFTGNQIWLRSSSGVIFKNRFSSTAQQYGIAVDHERSYRTDCPGAYGPRADGTRAWDQNTASQSGWRALGQTGWGPPQGSDMSTYSFAGVFAWDNTNVSTLVNLGITNNNPFTDTHLVFGRELFNAANMASGPLASRPATCTFSDLVGRDIYNATDQNVSGVQLYQCSATNTWTLHYEPYIYPHPLQGLESTNINRRTVPRFRRAAIDDTLYLVHH